jgi:hypothetical protein
LGAGREWPFLKRPSLPRSNLSRVFLERFRQHQHMRLRSCGC